MMKVLGTGEETSRVTIIRELFSQCSHQEQLALLEELPMFLCRDFISQLPVETVPAVLKYLEPTHVIASCLLVSWSWYHVISGCEVYWRTQYHRLHRIRANGAGDTRSFREATISVLRFERSLHRLSVCGKSPLRVSSKVVQRAPIGTSRSWFYTHTDDTAILVNVSSQTGCFIIDDGGELGGGRAVLWSWSTDKGALFYTHNGCWLFVGYPNTAKCDPPLTLNCDPPDLLLTSQTNLRLSVQMWQDDIYSPAHVVFGGCPKCQLAVRVTKHMGDGGVWRLDAVKLLKSETVQTESLLFHFLPDPQLQTSCLFTVLSVQLHPSDDSPVCLGTFCNNHTVYIQIGSGVVVNRLRYEEERGFELSDPLQYNWIDFNHNDPSNLTLSEDHLLALFMPNPETLCAWDLRNDVTYTHPLSPSTRSARPFVVSAGRLYSVVGLVSRGGGGTLVEVHVVSTTTGRTVLKALSTLSDTVVTSVTKALSSVDLDEAMTATDCRLLSHGLKCELLGFRSLCMWLSCDIPTIQSAVT